MTEPSPSPPSPPAVEKPEAPPSPSPSSPPQASTEQVPAEPIEQVHLEPQPLMIRGFKFITIPPPATDDPIITDTMMKYILASVALFFLIVITVSFIRKSRRPNIHIVISPELIEKLAAHQ